MTFEEALAQVTETLLACNPGQTVVVDRGHIDRDGVYFTVTVTSKDRIARAELATIREGLDETLAEREQKARDLAAWKLTHGDTESASWRNAWADGVKAARDEIAALKPGEG